MHFIAILMLLILNSMAYWRQNVALSLVVVMVYDVLQVRNMVFLNPASLGFQYTWAKEEDAGE